MNVSLLQVRHIAAPPRGTLLTAPSLIFLLWGCGAGERNASASQAPPLQEVIDLVGSRQYFTLRDRLLQSEADSSGAGLLGRAYAAHAFNDPEASNRAISRAISDKSLSDSLRFRLAVLRTGNLLRLGRYSEGVSAVDEALAKFAKSAPRKEIDDLANTRKIFAALIDVPSQVIMPHDSTTVNLTKGMIPVRVGSSDREYIFDTGANLSVLSRSEAARLGLRVRPADIDVGSSSDIRNRADLTVAPALTIGGMEFRNVVFLVFDDKLLTFPDFQIHGIIGFPVIEAMGEVRWRPSGNVTIPVTPVPRGLQNLALTGQTPLTQIKWRGEDLLCRLDTGASATDFYQPFYQRFRGVIDSIGRFDSTESGGVGGIRVLPVRRVPDFTASVGDTAFTWPRIDVITRTIVASATENYLDCNLGHDLLDTFSEYVFNFREMSFVLR